MSWLPLRPYQLKLRWINGVGSSCNEVERPILQRLGLTKPKRLPKSRRIQLGQRLLPSNVINTHIYSVLSFLPKFIFSQFKQFANLIFLGLSVMQIFPELSPYGQQSTSVPLVFIMLISAIRELYEDIMRRFRDAQVNDQKVWAHTEAGWKLIKWKKIHIGQLIRVDDCGQVPCDMLLVSSSDPGGIIYIQTANLDGESNLKIRQALAATAHLNTDTAVESLWTTAGTIVCEPPNKKIHEFQGYIELIGTGSSTVQRIPLSAGHLLLRGTRLKNTQFAYGISLYTGKDTKLMMNNNKKKLKRSAVYHMTNALMCLQFGICILLANVISITKRFASPNAFLGAMFGSDKEQKLYMNFLCSVVLLNGLVPISLYVTLEVVQTIQGFFIKMDQEFMDSNGKGADVKIFSLNSDLGRVQYVMSDKTGTLTQNCMRFRQCSIGGIKYANKKNKRDETFNTVRLKADMKTNERKNGGLIRDFLVACGACHTVTPEKTADAVRPIYHCTSPDESALVSTAADSGFVFQSRNGNSFVVDVDGKSVKYTMLALLEFTSDRKRMSVVVKAENEPIKLYVKGADHMIMDRLGPNRNNSVMKRTAKHLRNFATGGLRTLCFASRTLSLEEWSEIEVLYKEAECALDNKAALMATVAEMLEKDLELIGVSGIEDRLQDEVPETIERMLQAGIRLWVLTGDKLETAINIGNSCRLLSSSIPMMVLARETAEETRKDLDAFMAELGPRLEDRNHQLALIVDAVCLDFLLSKPFELDFLRLALSCSAVICCRCTPMQKATVTKLVKLSVDGAVLSIGDGANDVAMIQEADVGVGLSGQEGMQASIAADYTISQFRHLNRLLFVHGTLSLFRTSKCILFSIYKNVLETMLLFYFTFMNGRSDQPIADSWTIVRYNIFFTSFPALALGVMDRPTVLDKMEEQNYLYQTYDNLMKLKSFFRWYFYAILHSLLIIYILFSSFGEGAPHHGMTGRSSTLWMMGCIAYTQLVTVANMKAIVETSSITLVSVLFLFISIVLYYVGLLWDSFTWQIISFQEAHMGDIIFHYPIFYSFFILLLTIVACFSFDILQKTYSTDDVLHDQSIKKLYSPIVKLIDLVGKKMGHLEPGRNGFAFAQDDGQVLSQYQLMKQQGSNSSSTTSAIHPFNSKPSFRDEEVSINDRTIEPQSNQSINSKKQPVS